MSSMRVRTRPGTREPIHEGHSKRHCLRILQKLSAYLDDELSAEICADIRAHLGACPNCEIFLDSLRQTISLCRCHEPHPLSATARAMLRRQILKSVTSA